MPSGSASAGNCTMARFNPSTPPAWSWTTRGIRSQSLELPADRPEADRAMLGNARARLDDVVAALNRTIQDIRTYIYDLRSNAAEEDLARGLIQIVTEYRLRANLQIEWSVEGRPAWTLSADQRQHVYQITREALSNIVRHAGATKASVELRYAACPDRRIEAMPAPCRPGRSAGRAHVLEDQG